MLTVDRSDKLGSLRAHLRAMKPGECLRATGYTSQALRVAKLTVEEERRPERLIFAVDAFSSGGGSRRARLIVCGQDETQPNNT